MSADSIPFPTLDTEAPDRWAWPMPPFSWRHEPAPGNDVVQPVRIETPSGVAMEGEMLGFDPVAGLLAFRGAAGAPALNLPFSRFRRLTLLQPLRPLPKLAGAPPERVPAAAQERDYVLSGAEGREPLTGRTAGHVQTEAGLYLFEPVDEDQSLLRVFVPRWAYAECSFGRSAEEIAAEHWVATPEALLEAVERQKRMPVLKIGQALLNLGMLTPAQLERALQHKAPDEPLGEMLVSQGVISDDDLQTALAHKMGFPLVDLTRFPIDQDAVRRLPLRVARECHAVPLMVDQNRLIIAMDRPSREVELRARHVFTQAALVPVLATEAHIMLALAGLSQQDVWSSHHVRQRFAASR